MTLGATTGVTIRLHPDDAVLVAARDPTADSDPADSDLADDVAVLSMRMVTGGANVVCFTTGRGPVFGCRPVPSIKLATNTDRYRRVSEDMDVNCGVILDGEATVEEVGRDVHRLVVEVVSGRATVSEELGFGAAEFAPWQLGAVM